MFGGIRQVWRAYRGMPPHAQRNLRLSVARAAPVVASVGARAAVRTAIRRGYPSNSSLVAAAAYALGSSKSKSKSRHARSRACIAVGSRP